MVIVYFCIKHCAHRKTHGQMMHPFFSAANSIIFWKDILIVRNYLEVGGVLTSFYKLELLNGLFQMNLEK